MFSNCNITLKNMKIKLYIHLTTVLIGISNFPPPFQEHSKVEIYQNKLE